METEGLGKVEVAVAGSETEGFYGLLRGAIAHPSISSAPLSKKAHHILSATVSHLPPQEPTGITPKVSDPVARMAETGIRSCLSSSRGSSPCQHAALCIELGASKECTDTRLKVAKRDHQPYML